MGLSRSISAIVRNDARRLTRDRFLISVSLYIIAIAVALRWLLPWLTAELALASGFDFSPYLPVSVSYFVLVNASVLTGMVGGFLLLETREENTIKALLICPTPIGVHLGVLFSMIVLAGAALAIIEAPIVGIGTPPWPALIAAACLGAPMGIVSALILATFASNKVEAFAVMKLTGFMGLAPIAAYFLPEPYQYIAGVFPSFWACKIWWVATEGGSSWAWLLGPGFAVTAVWIAGLLPRFRAAARG